jgi:hypothetical protein
MEPHPGSAGLLPSPPNCVTFYSTMSAPFDRAGSRITTVRFAPSCILYWTLAAGSREAEVDERSPEVRMPEVGELSAWVVAAVGGRCLPDGFQHWRGRLLPGQFVLQG